MINIYLVKELNKIIKASFLTEIDKKRLSEMSWEAEKWAKGVVTGDVYLTFRKCLN